MTISLIPYGLLPNGNYGINVDPLTRQPVASVVEVMDSLPSAISSDNFDGRMVFDKSARILYVFSLLPTPQWKPLEGIPADVGNVSGNPPTTPVPENGGLYWDLDTQVLFVWDGALWQSAGGRYAATVAENNYIGNGVTSTYPTGSSITVPVEYVEIHWDGVRQLAGTDYTVVGTTVNFVLPPPNGVVVYIRTLVSEAIAQNAQISSSQHVAQSSQTDFSIGVAGVNPSGVFVFVDGVVQQLSTDYTLVQQNPTISSLIKTSPTVALVTTVDPHGIPAGSPVTLVGFVEVEYNNITYNVTSVVSPTSFEITVAPTAPVGGTPAPTAFFSPQYINDIVRFTTGLSSGQLVDIRSLRNVAVVGASAGEINTLASIGGGTQLNTAKVGTTLQLKSLRSGPNVSIIDSGTEVEISAALGSGFENRVGINTTVYTVTDPAVSYVGVRNASSPVTVSLTGIARIPANSGRTVTIKDESGGAGISAISVVASPALIDGSSSPYVINTNYGSVTLVFDGTDWYVTASRS